MINRLISAKIRKALEVSDVLLIEGPFHAGKTSLLQTSLKPNLYQSFLDYRFLDNELNIFFDSLLNNNEIKYLILDDLNDNSTILGPLQSFFLNQNKQLPHSRKKIILILNQPSTLADKLRGLFNNSLITLKFDSLTLTEIFERLTSTDPIKKTRSSGLQLTEILSAPPSSFVQNIIFKGFFPEIYEKKADPKDWYHQYYQNLLEHYIPQHLEIKDKSAFRTVIKELLNRTGEILNYSDLAKLSGVTIPTAKSWVDTLSDAGLIYLLPASEVTFGKRVMKSPKAYFIETGLACYLLGLRKSSDLEQHGLYSRLLESLVVGNLAKTFSALGEKPPMTYWKDNTDHHIPLILESGSQLFPFFFNFGDDTKMAKIQADEVSWWLKLLGDKMPQQRGFVFRLEATKKIISDNDTVVDIPWWFF